MIITWRVILAVCGGFLCIVGALREVQHIIKDFKAPVTKVEDKLANDYQRLNDHDKEIDDLKDTLEYIRECLNLQMENEMVMLEHMRTNNSTGKIAERENKIKQFLLAHQQGKED